MKKIKCEIKAAGQIKHDNRQKTPCIMDGSNLVNLMKMHYNIFSESVLEFQNLCKKNTKWLLTSFAPPYVKIPDVTKKGKLKCIYKIFIVFPPPWLKLDFDAILFS